MNDSSWLAMLAWIKRHSHLTRRALQQLPENRAHRLVVCFHLDAKMVPVIEGLARCLDLTVLPCNPLTADPEAIIYLKNLPLTLAKWDSRLSELSSISKGEPFWLCDLGGERILEALKDKLSLQGALEGTTTGIRKLRHHFSSCAPPVPLVDWNQNLLKESIHNEKMVGFSLWQTFTEVTRMSLHAKKVGVLGFGPVGRGIARTARDLGGQVSIFDRLPQLEWLARFESFATPGRTSLMESSQVLVTATGARDVIESNDLNHFKPGVFLLNAGHHHEEICEELRRGLPRTRVLDHIEEVWIPNSNQSFYLLSRGEVFNLSAGFGDTINAFDLTAAQLVEAVRYLLSEQAEQPGWLNVPENFSQTLWEQSYDSGCSGG